MQVALGGKRAAEVRIYNPTTSCDGRIVPESFAAARTIQAVSIVGLSGFGSSDSMPRLLRVTAMNWVAFSVDGPQPIFWSII